MAKRIALSHIVAAAAAALFPAAWSSAINLAEIGGGQLVRMDYASDGVTVGGTYDYQVLGLAPTAPPVGFLNVVTDFNNDQVVQPEEWLVQNVPIPLNPPILNSYPMLSAWFDPGPINLQPGVQYNTVSSIEPLEVIFPVPDPTWHFSNFNTNQFLWGANDPAGQNVVPIPATPDSSGGSIEVFKRGGVPDIAQMENECGPTSTANSLRWLAQQHNFSKQLPATDDQLIRDLMKAMTGSDARPFPGLRGNQLYDGKRKYANENNLPIVVKGGNTSAAASGAKAFDFIKQELNAGEDVEFLINWPGPGSHWVTAVGYGQNGNRLFLEVNDPDDGKTGPVDWELRPDGTFVNPRGTMLWAVSESFSPIFEWLPPLDPPNFFWDSPFWSLPGAPNDPLEMAVFAGGGISGGLGDVVLNGGDKIVNQIRFFNPAGSTYLLTSPDGSGLILDNGYGEGALFQNTPTENIIDVPIIAPQHLYVNVVDPLGSLQVNGVQTPLLHMDGAGVLTLNGPFDPLGDVLVTGGLLQPVLPLTLNTATISGTGGLLLPPTTAGLSLHLQAVVLEPTSAGLNVNNNAVTIDYGSDEGGSPLADIRALLASGYAGGDWDGPGIFSDTAAGAGNTALGYAEASDLGAIPPIFGPVDSTTVLVRYTLYGDANLDAAVNISDFSIVGSNFNQPGDWSDGNFNYDSLVDIGDFSLLAANFNLSLAAGARGAAVPEPVVGAGLALFLMACGRRKRVSPACLE